MKRITQLLGSLLIILIVAAACSKESYEPNPTPGDGNGSGGGTETPAISAEIQKASEFAQGALGIYYLWKDEIASAIVSQLDPETCTDPVATVKAIRYKQGGGYNSKQDEDRWSQLFDDITPFQESVDGISTTHGMNLSVGSFNDTNPQSYFFVVNFTYEDSPAAKAGVKRGDIIISYNGSDITDKNLDDAYYGVGTGEYGLGSWEPDGIHDKGKSVSMTAVKMYLNPIVCHKTFDVNGKKVGYLMYDSFDLDSAGKLIDICKQFKSEGVTELIIDLRYNGGGYVFTEELLASTFAPASNVKAGDLYMQEIYNDVLTEAFSKQDGKNFNKTYLSFDHEMGEESSKDYLKYNTEDANIGLNRIYAIVSSNTASASESLLVGLSPFVDIVTIGQQSHGKYCTGYILGVENLYETPPAIISKWGIYVMISTYADRNGNNIARPIGIVPSIEENDTPWEGFAIGNENESMLRAALTAAGKQYSVLATTRSLDMMPHFELKMLHDPYKFGKRIKQLPHLPTEEALK